MTNSTYFVQECPTCGRHLQVRVEYLGKRVVCPHCRGSLIAADSTTLDSGGSTLEKSLLRRADELLESAAQRRPTGRGSIFS